jgi:lipoyl(octanoyl) transferase
MDRCLKVVSHPKPLAYGLALANQMSLVDGLLTNPQAPYELHFLEHRSVLTLGRCFEQQHLVLDRADLARRNIDVVEVSRGGSVTYHGPGQLVAYVHVHLKEIGIYLTHYLRDLEQWVIDVLGALNIDAGRREGMTGVWTSKGKICAMGVAAKKFVTYHGIGLNFAVDLQCFNWIVPCGLSEPVASLSLWENLNVSRGQVEGLLLKHLPAWLASRERIEVQGQLME